MRKLLENSYLKTEKLLNQQRLDEPGQQDPDQAAPKGVSVSNQKLIIFFASAKIRAVLTWIMMEKTLTICLQYETSPSKVHLFVSIMA